MRGAFTIARRELGAYFSTAVGWLSLLSFLVLTGFFFASMVSFYSLQSTEAAFNPMMAEPLDLDQYLVAPFYANMAVILLFVCPGLTMRLFAEDQRQGSLDLLLTSPVPSWQVVVGKYLGAFGFVVVMLLSTAHYPLILMWLGTPDLGVLACSVLGVLLLAGAFLAVGLLASSLTENQVVALLLSFGMLLLLWVVAWADPAASSGWQKVLAYLSIMNHLEQLTRGLLHTKDVVYYLSFIGFFLFATTQRLEVMKWR